jgi:hypothetical protein
MGKMARIRWDDVENQHIRKRRLLEASFDEENLRYVDGGSDVDLYLNCGNTEHKFPLVS